MQYTSLGRSGATVSRICLGTMNFGPVIDEAASFQILDAAVDAGVTFIDTADVYGGPPWSERPGHTEEILGRWLHQRGRRDDVVLATKVYGTMGSGPSDRGLSALHIRAGVDASLRRLQTDRIDLLQMHHIDRAVPVDEVLEAFEVLRAQGKIVYLGSSNFAGWNLAQYAEHARATSSPRLVTEQSVYSLARRAIEAEVVPAAEHYGIGLLPWSPLAGGLLGGILAKRDRSRSQDHPDLAKHREAVEGYEQLAAAWGIPPGELALAWLLHQPAVTAPVVGPRTMDQFDGAVRAVEVTLSEEQLGELDRLWPGPGRAPESYAW